MARMTESSVKINVPLDGRINFKLTASQHERLSGDEMAVISPITGEAIGHVRRALSHDVPEAVQRAREAQIVWAAMSFKERARILMRLHDRLINAPTPIMDILQAEAGKSRRDTVNEVATTIGTIRYYAHHGEGHLRSEVRRGAFPLVTRGALHYKPVGVAGLICPWNFPLVLTIAEAVPALLAGNAVVLKPASLTPLSAMWGAEALADAGLPPDVLQVLPGNGREIGDAMIDHADFIGFTGSTQVGRKVAARCAERLIPYSMELGGKNAMIVLDDVNVGEAVDGLVNGAFNNCGQVCIAIERAYVPDSIYDALIARLVDAVKAVRIGCTPDFSTDMGSLISQEQVEAVEAHVEDARAKGARILAGGKRRPDLGPCFYEPTVIEGVTPDMLAAREETFGPVLCVYRVKSVDEAVARVNDSVYGLNASVWAGDLARGEAVARRIESGTVNVNDVMLIYFSFDLPMGGTKESGVGRRHGTYGIRKFTHRQSVITNARPVPMMGRIRLKMSLAQVRKFFALMKLWAKIPFLR
jgi:succinate-semialdehyde dehydrogenase/glutarate-semialdehyde dehydrogenase